MRKTIFLAIAFGILVILLLIIVTRSQSNVVLDQEQTLCYENAIYDLSEMNLSREGLTITEIKCEQQDHASQMLLTGYYSNYPDTKESIFFQRIAAGWAASGDDTHYEVCLIIGNKTVISKIETGRELTYQSEARCKWQNSIP
ncbi:hypothetical protein J4399_07030 [Candidatus Woesearchaeota archaeon]|nr:hypothetical protein [Candidatus Woesearchaeota archaeon]HIH54831.1 hypothetical protein [Candidatus Woesearchaeota archaeon]HIJ01630.1 hypothetical protein [Candidatus Woesearchaeota archaeon]